MSWKSVGAAACARSTRTMLLALSFTGLMTAGAAAQTVVGTISVCYYAPNCTYTESIGLTPPVDSPAFLITNTSESTITNARFTIKANAANEVAKDSFKIGKLKPGHSVVIVPQYSNDGGTNHPPGALFFFTGSPLDTSESGPDANNNKFIFTGSMGALTVSSGIIEPKATVGPSNDATVSKINFLGGPANADGPCNDCVGPFQIGTLTAQ